MCPCGATEFFAAFRDFAFASADANSRGDLTQLQPLAQEVFEIYTSTGSNKDKIDGESVIWAADFDRVRKDYLTALETFMPDIIRGVAARSQKFHPTTGVEEEDLLEYRLNSKLRTYNSYLQDMDTNFATINLALNGQDNSFVKYGTFQDFPRSGATAMLQY